MTDDASWLWLRTGQDPLLDGLLALLSSALEARRVCVLLRPDDRAWFEGALQLACETMPELAQIQASAGLGASEAESARLVVLAPEPLGVERGQLLSQAALQVAMHLTERASHQAGLAKLARRAQELSEQRFAALVEFAPVGIFETSLEGQCVYANERACELVGLTLDEFLGHGWMKNLHPDDVAGVAARRAEARAAGTGLRHDVRFVHAGKIVFVRVKSVPLVIDGERCGYLGALVDLTTLQQAQEALAKSLSEKETLLKEIHHRVKNNLQVVSSLLRLGRGYVTDAASLGIFNDSIARVQSMALIHEQLYQSEDLGKIEIGSYLRNLATELVRSHTTQHRVGLHVSAERISFGMDRCVPLGLIVTELVNNALKHAFQGSDAIQPSVVISLSRQAEGYELIVRDNGSGLSSAEAPESSLGLRLVTSLAKQLGGTYRSESSLGTVCHVAFPIEPNGE
jgi:PAS domain S-box-containing protein